MVRGTALAAVVVAGVAAGAPDAVSRAPSSVPADVRALLVSALALTESQLAQVHDGQPVAVAATPTVDREIVVGGAIRMAVPASRLVALIRDIERLERGSGFLATHRFSTPPGPADVAALRLPDQDVASLRGCRPGHCAVKLGQAAFDELARVDWRAPDAAEQAHALARRMALTYLADYTTGGNRALAVYRDTSSPIDIAGELDDMVRRWGVVTALLPEVAAYLLDYPNHRPLRVDDFFYWSLAEFGLKPVLRLNHVVVHPTGRTGGLQYVVTTKQLYASHYFHAALEVRALFDDPERPGRGHYLVVVNMARSDGLTGLFGGFVRSRARGGARNGLQSALAAMKRRAEGR